MRSREFAFFGWFVPVRPGFCHRGLGRKATGRPRRTGNSGTLGASYTSWKTQMTRPTIRSMAVSAGSSWLG